MFSLLLPYAFGSSEYGVLFHICPDGTFFNLSLLRVKTKVCQLTPCNLSFIGNVALTCQSQADLQCLINSFIYACMQFAFVISLKQMSVMGQDVYHMPIISIGDWMRSQYLCTLSRESQTSCCWMLRSMNTSAKQRQPWLDGPRVLKNSKLTMNTKIRVLDSLLYDLDT